MAGRGPAARPAETLQSGSRQRKRKAETKVVEFSRRGVQPALPDYFEVRRRDGVEQLPFHPDTVKFWQHLGESPLMADLTDTDWDFLARTMMLDSRYLYGEFHVAQEWRLQLTQFGLTPDARARQRMQVAFAVESEVKTRNASAEIPTGDSVRARRGGLRAV